jgi:hypothetical protein
MQVWILTWILVKKREREIYIKEFKKEKDVLSL